MRRVTNVIVTGFHEYRKLAELNALPWHHSGRGLVSCDYAKPELTWYGGNKYLEKEIWIGAFSEVDVPALAAAMRKVDWYDPEAVRLYVSEGERGRFICIDWTSLGAEADGSAAHPEREQGE